ncbi:MAG: pyridoxamine 5'-phosphate oxidase family protein [Deltaproteobacteria bacterium]|nr:pyridoxamine 5'-phosphate oxidase family protein [Deltaproteobacteria bacterium]
MNLYDDWPEIRRIFARSFYASMATVNEDGFPHVTPIGSLLLHREPGRGFWFEIFTTHLPSNLDRDSRLCAMAVDTRLSLWGRALVSGQFPRAPGIRLSGLAGARREATAREQELFERRVRLVRWTRGYKLLWSRFGEGREVTFDRALPIRLGRMWPVGPNAKSH